MEGKSLSGKKNELVKGNDAQIAASNFNTPKVSPGDDSDRTHSSVFIYGDSAQDKDPPFQTHYL